MFLVTSELELTKVCEQAVIIIHYTFPEHTKDSRVLTLILVIELSMLSNKLIMAKSGSLLNSKQVTKNIFSTNLALHQCKAVIVYVTKHLGYQGHMHCLVV